MSMKYFGIWLVIVSLLGLSGCFEGKNDLSKQGVCILDKTSLRTEPTKKGEWISSLALGETVKIEGKAEKDPADPKAEYIKVSLSDGTKGYASTYCIVRGAYVGVIQKPAKIYKRPDLLAESDKKFDLMQIVAVEEEKDNWLRVTGEGRTKIGWIEKDSIRKDKEDVVTAALLRKAIGGKERSRAEMEEIISKLPYPDNYFATVAMEKYDSDDSTGEEQPADSDDVNTGEDQGD